MSRTGAQLDYLLSQAEVLTEVQSGSKTSFSELEELRSTLTRLRQKHGVTKRQLVGTLGTSTVRSLIQSRLIEEKPGVSPEEMSQTVEATIQKIIRTNLDHTLGQLSIAHRLTGKTMFQLDNRIGIRFETFYNSQFQKSFYVLFDYDPKTKALFVFKHSIPYFIPLESISERFLNKSIKLFSEALSDYLNAHVSRKQQFLSLKSLLDDEAKFQCNDSCDFLEFTHTYQNRSYEFKVIYDDLKNTTPSRVAVFTVTKAQEKQRWRQFETEFMKSTLENAFNDIFG